MKIIQFMRTNVVKMAVSGYRGRQTHDACGESNLKTTVAQKVGLGQNCALPATVNWTVSEFAAEVGTWQQRADAFNDFVAGDGAAQALRAVPTLLVPYEDMQIDADVTFQVRLVPHLFALSCFTLLHVCGFLPTENLLLLGAVARVREPRGTRGPHQQRRRVDEAHAGGPQPAAHVVSRHRDGARGRRRCRHRHRRLETNSGGRGQRLGGLRVLAAPAGRRVATRLSPLHAAHPRQKRRRPRPRRLPACVMQAAV